MKPSTHAASQYLETTENLTARMAIHAYSTNPKSWFTWLGERLPVVGDILEVGAGTGELWRHVGHSAAQLTLVDFSPAMCARLQEISGAIVEQVDAASLPFEAASFDSLIANHMLYHVDPDAALKEFSRVLKPGGRLLVSLNGHDHLPELKAIGQSIGRNDVLSSESLNDVTAETGPGYLKQYFTDVVVEEYPGDLDIPTVKPVMDYILTTGQGNFTDAQKSAAQKLIEDRIAAKGSFRIHRHTVLLTARRHA